MTSERHLLDAFFDHTHLGMAIVDANLCFTRVNAALAVMDGVPVNQHEGRPVAEVAATFGAKTIELIKQVHATNTVVHEEVSVPTPQGRFQFACWHISVFPIPGAQPCVGFTVLDISERKQAEEHLKELANTMPQLVWSATGDGHVDYYNDRRREYANPDGQVLDWRPLVHSEDRAATSAAWLQANTPGDGDSVYEMKHRLLRADGSYEWHVSRAVGIRDTKGEVSRWYGTATNIQSVQSAFERERGARIEAERVAHFAQVFIGILGHDLRNPLSAIKMGAQMLSMTPANAPADRVQKIGTRIANSADRMTRMIEQLLDFTRVRLGVGLEVRPSAFDLAELIADLVEELRAAHSQRTLTFSRDGAMVGTWDRDRLGQVFSNLLSNALVHGDAAAPVVVSINGTTNDQVVIEVSNGGAIPEDVMPDLLKPFRRGASSSRQGLGLGLFIADEIIRLHGGKMELTSTPQDGTRFKITLPRTHLPA
ncbi:MAG: ATP-binding protein [Deltaproteobacteria bacterium]|nr:ATP-binding protein [Deltaproteobacteria bacterium]